MSISENKKFDIFNKNDLSLLSVNFNYARVIYAEIFEDMLLGGFEVSFSIF